MHWNFILELTDFFYPDRCLFCEEETKSELLDYPLICTDCKKFLQVLTSQELQHYHQVYLKDNFDRSIIGFQFDELTQKLLHFVKYHNGIKLANYLGDLIFESQKHHFEQYDAILPCPLHPRKQREREFNQAEEIAKGLAKKLKLQIDTSSLSRSRYTKTQTQLNKNERIQNLEGAFHFIDLKKYSRIILLDDVITTGSTLNTIAQTIKSVNPNILLTAVSFASPI